MRKSGVTKLRWLQQISVPARMNTPESVDAGLIFDGDTPAPDLDYANKILVRIRRGTAQVRPGIAGVINVDVVAGPEPPRWPVSYAVAMTIAGVPTNIAAVTGLAFRFNPAFAEELFAGSGHTYKELMEMAAAGKPLPSFALPVTLRAKMKFEASDLKSDNIVGVLPGSDPALAAEYVVISAHLDGYGIGEPWNGDKIYNGAFDDAAYVATLIDFAEKLKASGTRLKRSRPVSGGDGGREGIARLALLRGASHGAQGAHGGQCESGSIASDFPAEDPDHSGAGRFHAGRHGEAGCPDPWGSAFKRIPNRSATCFAAATTGA